MLFQQIILSEFDYKFVQDLGMYFIWFPGLVGRSFVSFKYMHKLTCVLYSVTKDILNVSKTK